MLSLGFPSWKIRILHPLFCKFPLLHKHQVSSLMTIVLSHTIYKRLPPPLIWAIQCPCSQFLFWLLNKTFFQVAKLPHTLQTLAFNNKTLKILSNACNVFSSGQTQKTFQKHQAKKITLHLFNDNGKHFHHALEFLKRRLPLGSTWP
jgi:hypothetical protein